MRERGTVTENETERVQSDAGKTKLESTANLKIHFRFKLQIEPVFCQDKIDSRRH